MSAYHSNMIDEKQKGEVKKMKQTKTDDSEHLIYNADKQQTEKDFQEVFKHKKKKQ